MYIYTLLGKYITNIIAAATNHFNSVIVLLKTLGIFTLKPSFFWS